MERVVLEAQLRDPAVGDVRQRAGHPRRRAVDVADRQPAGHHPAPAAVGVAHAVLGLQMRRAGRRGGRRSRRAAAAGRPACTRSNQARRVVVAGVLGPAEDRVPARREVDPVRSPGPSPRSRRWRRAPPARSAPRCATGRDACWWLMRVADRALERGGVELLLDQVVGHAERGRLEVDLVVGLTGEHDHRARGRDREALSRRARARCARPGGSRSGRRRGCCSRIAASALVVAPCATRPRSAPGPGARACRG